MVNGRFDPLDQPGKRKSIHRSPFTIHHSLFTQLE